MNHFNYEDLHLGQTGGFNTKVTEEMMKSFRAITGDVNPLHSDAEFAGKHGYTSKVVYGMLTSSFLSTLAGVYLPGEKSLIQSVEVKFVKPVFVGDELHVSGLVDELNDTVRQIVLKVEIRKNDGTKVLRGRMKVGVQND